MASIGKVQTQQAEEVTTEVQGHRYITLENFYNEFNDTDDAYKYEWNDGVVEKSPSMNQFQSLINNVLLRLFFQTKMAQEGSVFNIETDMRTSQFQLRRPDLAIYSAKQKANFSKENTEIAQWVGEVISPSDKSSHIHTKLVEYFRAGVKCVWHIFPELQQVYVYTAIDKVTICQGKTVCEAIPVSDEFRISAKDLFADLN